MPRGRALVLGGGGLVGRALTAELVGRGIEQRSLTHQEVDITDRESVLRAVAELSPAVIYNCAAFTRVDDCETEVDLARSVNEGGVANIVEAARGVGARVVQLSTDYVFDGRAQTPYDESAPTGPMSRYGETKLAGERAALSDPNALVVRTSWIFGSTGPSFVQTVIRLLAGEAPVRMVSDQIGGPTYAPFLARALVDLDDVGARGIVHYQNREPVSWFGFACAIAETAGVARDITPVTTAEFPRPARRPAWSVLSVEGFEKLVSRPVEKWQTGLEDCLARLNGGEAR